jgi:hypothetical protein
MKEDLRLQFRGVSGPAEGKNRMREYLQARILASMQRSGAMIPLAFQGGTKARSTERLNDSAEPTDPSTERTNRRPWKAQTAERFNDSSERTDPSAE